MKVNYCLIGITLLFSGIYMSLIKKDKPVFTNFYELLNEEQKMKYDKITKERLMIYITGSILGLFLAYIYYFKNKNDKYLFCKLLAIINIVKLSFYYFFPKSPLMIYSLTTKEQTDAWADIYVEMKNNWIISLAFGFFAYIFLSLGIIK